MNGMRRAIAALVAVGALWTLPGCHNEEHKQQQRQEAQERHERARKEREAQGRGDNRNDQPAPNPEIDPPPRPQPVPTLSDNATRPVTVECIWKKRRWITMTVMVNNEPVLGWDRRQVKYNSDGVSGDPESGGGIETKNVGVKKGDHVSVICTPHPDTPQGYMSAWVRFFNNVRDFQHVQIGPASAGWTVDQ